MAGSDNGGLWRGRDCDLAVSRGLLVESSRLLGIVLLACELAESGAKDVVVLG